MIGDEEVAEREQSKSTKALTAPPHENRFGLMINRVLMAHGTVPSLRRLNTMAMDREGELVRLARKTRRRRPTEEDD
jgi:hypothetical protein